MDYPNYLEKTISVMKLMLNNDYQIKAALEVMKKTLSKDGTLYFCGNGGSAADAQHWAAEFVGKFRIAGHPISAIALTTNTSIITAIANDISFDYVYSRQIEATGRNGDILCAISTSGESKSIIEAAITAKKIGMQVISLTGQNKNSLDEISHISVKVPSTETEIIQHVHVTIGHYLAGELEVLFRKDDTK